MKYHPLAEIFPLLEGAEFEALVADIKAHGLQNPITLYKEMILDGRNRHRACEAAGVEPLYDDYEGDDPVGFVISQNLKRRHLGIEQRILIASKLENTPLGRPKKDAPVHVLRTEAATLLGVSVRSVANGKVVLETATAEVIHAVEQGRLAVSRAVEIAKLPVDDQKMLVTHMSEDDIITNHERIKKENKRKATFERIHADSLPTQDWPTGKFSVIYADPPVEDDYGHTKRDVEHHYPTMTWEELEALAVDQLTTKDAVLYLWMPPQMLEKGFRLMTIWGFEYRTHLVWEKDLIGLGAWVRNKHECLMIGRKGNFPPPPELLRPMSVIASPRGEHSAKPEGFAEMIEAWYPEAVKLELFRRGPARDGWVVWGLEATEAAA